jgi:transcriptional regulator with GAF, ATPase, and Fis domain
MSKKVESKMKTTVKKSIGPVKKPIVRKSMGKKPATKKNAPVSLEQQLAQRNAELAIINSIQQGLASKLELQAIIDLVGEKIGEIFDAQVVDIITYDHQTGLCYWSYSVEKGKRYYDPPRLPTGFSGYIIKTQQPLMINKDLEKQSAQYGSSVISGESPKSYLGVPLIVGNEAKGVISLQYIDRENAFADSDLRLLTTLANSMSVALENARLFDETQRLLNETEQRAQELAIINSVQTGLASKLEFQAIIDLIGEKIREIFDAQATLISLYNRETNEINHRCFN